MKPSTISHILRIFNPKNPFSLDDLIRGDIKKYKLKGRAINACNDQTNYDIRLRNFMTNNNDNIVLLTKIAGHMEYLKKQGLSHQQASKETLELIVN